MRNTFRGRLVQVFFYDKEAQPSQKIGSGLHSGNLLPFDPLDSSNIEYSMKWKAYNTIEIIKCKLCNTNCFLQFISTLIFDVQSSHQVNL